MERAPRRELFYRRHHPYTEGLLRSLPTAGRRGGGCTPIAGHAAEPDHAAAGLPVRTRVARTRSTRAHETPPLAEVAGRPGAHVGVLAAADVAEP